MERIPKVVLIGAGILLALAGAGVVFFLMGGSGDLPSPQAAFGDADERFRVESDEATSRSHGFSVPRGTSVMTVSISIEAEEGGEWRLLDTQGGQRGIIPREVSFQIPSASFLAHRPDPGTWSVEVVCQAACSYTAAVHFRDVIEEPEGPLSGDLGDHDEVIHHVHDQAASREQTFEVPRGTQFLEAAISFYAPENARFQIMDPSGEEIEGWSWTGKWLVRGYASVIDEQPRPGTWTVRIDCSQGCEGSWGFSFVQPPES